MEKGKPNSPNKISNQGYVIVPNYFLRDWVKVLGIGPALLYLELLSYCHKEKDIVWPTLTTLSHKLAISKNSLISYRKTLLKYGLIKKIVKRRTAQGNYQPNFYKVTPLEGAKIELHQVQNLGGGSAKIAPGVVQNLHPNNNNIKHYPYNNNKGVVAVVNFNKLEKASPAKAGEKGEEKMQALREQLIALSFEEKFIEQLLKDFSLEKMEEKLELLMAKTNIQNPSGWLLAALKNDYQGSQKEEIQEVREEKKAEPPRKISSWEEALRQIRLAQEKLALITPSYQIKENEEKGGLPLGT